MDRDAQRKLRSIILLDQFSLTLHRNQAQGFTQIENALPIAKKMIAGGWDQDLTLAERVFVYLPLEHSENMADQDQSIQLFKKLQNDAQTEILLFEFPESFPILVG